jgi:hypothetical protein
MLNKEELFTAFMQITLSDIFADHSALPLKIDVWRVFCGLLLTENDEYFYYDVTTLSRTTEDVMISSLLAWEKEHGHSPILQQLFCVITSKSCEE